MADLVKGYRPRRKYLDAWGAEVLFMVDEVNKVVYVPVRPVCATLGIAPQTQVDRIQKDEQYEGAIEEISVPTAGGRQDMVCLRAKEAAWWVFSIAPKRLPAHLRDNLAAMKQALMDAADRLLFGDLTQVVYKGQLQLGRPTRGNIRGGCPRCGAPLIQVIGGEGHPRFEIDDNADEE
jgi:hypothetical protein